MASPSETQHPQHRVLRLVPSGTRLAVDKLELLLAEKQTALALARTSITVLALPVSILVALVATSSHYQFTAVLYLVLPLLGVCTALLGLGTHLLVRALRELRQLDQRIAAVKEKSPVLLGSGG